MELVVNEDLFEKIGAAEVEKKERKLHSTYSWKFMVQVNIAFQAALIFQFFTEVLL